MLCYVSKLIFYDYCCDFLQRCNKCVVDMDHHCLVSMTCVGRGNRRLHLLFMVAAASVCLLYLFLALHVEHFVHCSDATGMLWGLIAVQKCIWSSDPAFAAVPIVLVLLINYAGILAIRLLRNVALETTVVDVSLICCHFLHLVE